MTFSETVKAAVAKGWGQGDQNKMLKAFGINRAMADKVAMACEHEYIALSRNAKLEAKAKEEAFWAAKRAHTAELNAARKPAK